MSNVEVCYKCLSCGKHFDKQRNAERCCFNLSLVPGSDYEIKELNIEGSYNGDMCLNFSISCDIQIYDNIIKDFSFSYGEYQGINIFIKSEKEICEMFEHKKVNDMDPNEIFDILINSIYFISKDDKNLVENLVENGIVFYCEDVIKKIEEYKNPIETVLLFDLGSKSVDVDLKMNNVTFRYL
jgi:hypothetical protein